MSNIKNDNEIEIFKFISSSEFIAKLIEKKFHPIEHNLLLSAHLLAIGFNTTGINDGSVNLMYKRQIAPIEEKFFTVKSNFAFYTTKNGLIEDSPYFNRQTMNFNHSMFSFKDTRGFRDFCIKYFDKHSKIVDMNQGETIINKKLDNKIHFRLNGKKRKSEEGQLYGYHSIVCSNPYVKTLIEAWCLENELIINDNVKPKRLKL